MRTGLTWVRRSVESAQEAGDLIFACYAGFMLSPYRCVSESLSRTCSGKPNRLSSMRASCRFSWLT